MRAAEKEQKWRKEMVLDFFSVTAYTWWAWQNAVLTDLQKADTIHKKP
jgi:hypothetical protein